MQAQVDRLRAKLEQRPTRVVVKNLDQETVDRAVADRQEAYGSRDRAFRVFGGLPIVALHNNLRLSTCWRAPHRRSRPRLILDADDLTQRRAGWRGGVGLTSAKTNHPEQSGPRVRGARPRPTVFQILPKHVVTLRPAGRHPCRPLDRHDAPPDRAPICRTLGLPSRA